MKLKLKIPQIQLNEHLKAWGLLLGIALLILIILNSPVFNLRTYEIQGTERISDEDVLHQLELKEGTNLFRYALAHLNSSPTVDSRLSSVDVYFKWPSHVKIVVEESSTIGYVYFQGMYLCIDRKGQVANTTREPDEDLPTIVGLKVGSFNIGERLTVEETGKYDAVVSIGTALRKYDLQNDVYEVNVRVLDDILLFSDKLEIHIGSIKDVERKICVAAEVMRMDSIPKGILHIENMDSQIYVEPFELPAETDE
ncbi:MAG: FtsQ-type POTRA domain-containing protein [Lachnospiraceae bacterium]|nr:FtsQ-type POTRA domain-containing protein [Lachnospiraceae bacterium]